MAGAKRWKSHSEELCDEASMLKQPHCWHRAGLNMDLSPTAHDDR